MQSITIKESSLLLQAKLEMAGFRNKEDKKLNCYR